MPRPSAGIRLPPPPSTAASPKTASGTGWASNVETLCLDLAKRKGWPVVDVYVDNDLSAYSGKPRPAYERPLTDLQAGLLDAVIVVDQDRLTRRLAELGDSIELAERHNIALANVSGDVDLSNSDGRFRARSMGVVARQESEKKSERLRRQRHQAASKAVPTAGDAPSATKATA